MQEKHEKEGASPTERPLPHAVPLEDLTAKTASVWARCGGDAGAGSALPQVPHGQDMVSLHGWPLVRHRSYALLQGAPLAMLAALEAQLERMIAAAAQLPPDLVEATERAAESARRQVRSWRMT